MSGQLVTLATEVLSALAAHTWTTSGLTVTTERKWAPEWEKHSALNTAGQMLLTVIPGGTETDRIDDTDFQRTPIIGLVAQTRCESESHCDRAADFIDELLTFLEDALQVKSTTGCSIDTIEVPRIVDHDVLRDARVWRTAIVLRFMGNLIQ